MGSYYREHVAFPNVAAGPYPPQLIAALENDGANANAQDEDPDNRLCSVKGCSAPLPSGYTNKMCEECRGRHRVYAMTKRAKRKMEKSLMNGQGVVWMPQDDAMEQDGLQSGPVAGPSRQYEDRQCEQAESENVQQFDFQDWDTRAIDPRLFSQTSELAGALTLPGLSHPHITSNHDLYARNDHQPQQPPTPVAKPPAVSPGPPPPPPAPEIHPVLAEVLKAVPNFTLSTRVTSGPTVSATSASLDGPLPPRFCSVKGCKALVAGNSFFKMCEPCRDRYRNYGTTKRAKWRREKQVAVAELNKLRKEENERRTTQGLPPLPAAEDENWQEHDLATKDTGDPAAAPSSASATPPSTEPIDPSAPLPPRMCTVSHCREILPGEYKYLRCERHRIQNRHHSKLKRVRDKEVKAHVNDEWAAAIGAQTSGSTTMEQTAEDGDTLADMSLSATEIAQVFGEIEKELRDASLGPDFAGGIAAEAESGPGDDQLEDTPLGEPSHGVPPAARGTRRTNHVCSIKTCANLLSPSNPWKMCDLCRSRDRAGRRLKALRDSGVIPPEVAAGKIVEVKMEVEAKDRRERRERKDKGTKKKPKGKKAQKIPNAPQPTSDDPPPPAADIVASDSGSGNGVDTAAQAEEPGSSVDGAKAPLASSAVQHDPQPSLFSGVSLSDAANLVFTEPMLGELASTIKEHLSQMLAGNSASTANTIQPSEVRQVEITQQSAPSSHEHSSAMETTTTITETVPIPKKRSRGMGKAKSAAQPVTNEQSVEESQPPTHTPPSAIHVDAVPSRPDSVGSTPGAPTEELPHLPPPYPPPPPHGQPPYPYYMPPYMSPYPPPPMNYYGYSSPPPPPASSSPKGSYAQAPPPMYQPPYSSYPYPYPYPGQPYHYHGQSYAPPPPPPGQAYSPPSHHLPEHFHPPAGQPYPAPAPPIPYAHPHSSPRPYPQHHPHTHPPPPSPPPQQPQDSTPPPASPATSASMPVTSAYKPSSASSSTPSTGTTTDSHVRDGGRSGTGSTNESASGQRTAMTFVVRTSATYESPPPVTTNGSKPVFSIKRKRDDESGGMSPYKRAELEAAGSYSTFRVCLPGHDDPSDPSTSGVYARELIGEAYEERYRERQPFAVAPGDVQDKISCANKSCKRVVPGGSSGAFCDRCRERFKKRQAKAKHRFKLEPKTLVRSTGVSGVVARV